MRALPFVCLLGFVGLVKVRLLQQKKQTSEALKVGL